MTEGIFFANLNIVVMLLSTHNDLSFQKLQDDILNEHERPWLINFIGGSESVSDLEMKKLPSLLKDIKV